MITAVKLPLLTGLVENRTVSEVAEALVTVPMAPLLKTTVLFAGTALKPKPVSTMLVAVRDKLAVEAVTTGTTFARRIGEPLDAPLVVTTPVRLPSLLGLVVRFTVSEFAVAAVTTPTAPLLNATVLFDAVVLKPKPLIVTVDALAPILVELTVTIGEMLATRTGTPLVAPLTVTTAVSRPADGRVESSTVSVVAVEAITVPDAPLFSVTLLFAAVVSKPAPSTVIVVGSRASTELLVVTVGATLATWTGSPLLCELLVTVAVKLPTAVGFVPKVTISDVAVADVTVPAAPLLKTTVLLAGVVLNPNPRTIRVFAVIFWTATPAVTTGTTVAT